MENEETKSLYKDISLYESNEEPKKIMYKPRWTAPALLVIGILLIISWKIYSIIIGIIVIFTAYIVQFKVEDKVALSIYSDHLLIHDPNDQNKAICLEYGEIKTWGRQDDQSVADGISFLVGDEIYKVETYRLREAYSELGRHIGDKQAKSSIFWESSRKRK